MAGQQWEYGYSTVATRIVEQGVRVQGTVGSAQRLVVVGTVGSVPAHETVQPNDRLGSYLDKVGEEGWELVGTLNQNSQWVLVFKRPKGWTK